MQERQLKWVQHNRAWRKMPTTVGDEVKKLLRSPLLAGSAMQRRLVSILEEYAGEALLDHASVVGLLNGVLTLYASDAAVLYQLRLQWEQKLLALMQAQLPGAGIHEIRFTTCLPR